MKVCGLTLCLVLLGGCALFTVDRPQVTLDYGTACLTYADARATIAVTEVRLVDACAAGTFTPASCTDMGKARDRLALADRYVRDMLKNPKTPVDWAKVNEFLLEALGILVKMGAKSL